MYNTKTQLTKYLISVYLQFAKKNKCKITQTKIKQTINEVVEDIKNKKIACKKQKWAKKYTTEIEDSNLEMETFESYYRFDIEQFEKAFIEKLNNEKVTEYYETLLLIKDIIL
jgi:type III secretory pathway lipoprotein EscJ